MHKMKPLLTLTMTLILVAAGTSLAQTTEDTQTWNGVTVRCSKMFLLGGEEHGLEVVSVDPKSPMAAQLRGPLQAEPGDLIVAINDVRVRCPISLEEQLAKARPLQPTLTIIRSLPDDRRQARKISVELDEKPSVPLTGPPAGEPSLGPR
jgi:S1-C subfamily serine protease